MRSDANFAVPVLISSLAIAGVPQTQSARQANSTPSFVGPGAPTFSCQLPSEIRPQAGYGLGIQQFTAAGPRASS